MAYHATGLIANRLPQESSSRLRWAAPQKADGAILLPAGAEPRYELTGNLAAMIAEGIGWLATRLQRLTIFTLVAVRKASASLPTGMQGTDYRDL